MNPQDPILKVVKVSYFRLTLAALASGLVNAFNTNKTSWVGLGLFYGGHQVPKPGILKQKVITFYFSSVW